MGFAALCLMAVLAVPALSEPQGYGAGPARRPQKVWTTTPFPDEVAPASNDVYQQPPPQSAGQPSAPSAPSAPGAYWWASGSRPFSPQATGPVAPAPAPAPAVSPGNPFLQGGRPQAQQPPSGGYGSAPGGAPQTPTYDIPCSQPGQVCVGIGKCQDGYVAPGANGIRQGQCSSTSQTCCRLPPIPPQNHGGPPQYQQGYRPPPPPPQPQQGYGPPPPPPQQQGYVLPAPPRQQGYAQPQQPIQTYYQPPPQQPQPTPGPYTGPLNTTPYPGCAAALKCVEEVYCTAEGVMSNSPVYLTREQQDNRVPMTDCQNPDTGILGKCCRDPNYTDPWPGGMMMKNMPTGPGAPAPPPAPPAPPVDTCANSGGVCVPSQQCPAQSRMQPEQDCRTLPSGLQGKCCSYTANVIGGGGGGY